MSGLFASEYMNATEWLNVNNPSIAERNWGMTKNFTIPAPNGAEQQDKTMTNDQ